MTLTGEQVLNKLVDFYIQDPDQFVMFPKDLVESLEALKKEIQSHDEGQNVE